MTVQTTKEPSGFNVDEIKNTILPGSLNTTLCSATDIYSEPQLYLHFILLPVISFPIRLQQYPWTDTTFSISLGISIKNPFDLISSDVYQMGPIAKTAKERRRKKSPLQQVVYRSHVWKEVDSGVANLPLDISKQRLSQTTELCSVKLLSGVLWTTEQLERPSP